MRAWRVAAGLAPVLILGQPLAQTPVDSGVIQQRQIDEERRRREAEREQRQVPAEPLRREPVRPPTMRPEAESIRFAVREIRFTESAILSQAELESASRPYVGRELTLGELGQLAAKVNEIYRGKGVVTAQATVPPQDVSAGVVLIRLVEGRLGQVAVRGNASTEADYVADRVGLKPTDLIDLTRLEAALNWFNRTNDAQLRAELKPGGRFATTDIAVEITEPPRHDLRVTIDNMGAAATGRNRVGLAYANRSLLGYRDELALSATHALGQESRSVAYGVPINTWGGRANLGFYDDRTAMKEGPLRSLRITGHSTASILSIRQPVHVGPTLEVDVVGGGKSRHNTSWISNVFLSRTDTTDRNLGVEAQVFGADSGWSASYVRSVGEARTVGRDGFRVDRGSLRHYRDIGGGLSFRGALAWQVSPQAGLPSSEQLFIGGEGSVRGYPVGLYSGDKGQTVSLELHHPLAGPGGSGGLAANGFLFLDYGRVKPQRPPASTLRSFEALTGLGWGLNLNLGHHVSARLVFGYGATRVPLQPRSYDVTLQLVASVF